MTTKQYLSQLFHLNKTINNYTQRLYQLKEQATSLSFNHTKHERVQTSGVIDRVGNTVAMIVDLENKIKAKMDKLVRLSSEIEGYIEMISQENVRVIMYKRYVLFKGWEEVAREVSYAVGHVYRLHSLGLREVEKIILSYSKGDK